MSQDLRKLFTQEKEERFIMKAGHEERFMDLLDKELPKSKSSYMYFFKIAASMLVLISAGIFAYVQFNPEVPVKTTVVEKSSQENEISPITLGDLSPDLKKVESYYVANINLEISKLEISESNKSLVDSYLARLSDLNMEYDVLNDELNTMGPNDQTITALIKNLQLRLELLHKLKDKLNELKSSENETVAANTI
jgi:hypothetical protein